jgi:hypothetical protein
VECTILVPSGICNPRNYVFSAAALTGFAQALNTGRAAFPALRHADDNDSAGELTAAGMEFDADARPFLAMKGSVTGRARDALRGSVAASVSIDFQGTVSAYKGMYSVEFISVMQIARLTTDPTPERAYEALAILADDDNSGDATPAARALWASPLAEIDWQAMDPAARAATWTAGMQARAMQRLYGRVI